MKPIGFVGRGNPEDRVARDLLAAGARTVIVDLRDLKSAVNELRGW